MFYPVYLALWRREYDIVIADEVDSMLIDQGVQCTYLSHDIGNFGMHVYDV